VVGVEPPWAAPMPSSATRLAQHGWPPRLGYHHLRSAGPGGRRRRTRAAVVHDSGHSSKQCLLVDLADGEAVVPVVDQRQVSPAAGDERAAAPRADRLNGDPGDVLREPAHAAEAHIHRWFVGVQERHQLGSGRSSGRIHAAVRTTAGWPAMRSTTEAVATARMFGNRSFSALMPKKWSPWPCAVNTWYSSGAAGWPVSDGDIELPTLLD
jgi:hypothetical protein